MSKLYIITGPAGVGKTTISDALSKRLDKCAVIEGDEIYHMVRNPYVSPWKENNHLEIFWKNVYSLIRNFLDDGYDVVFNYIVKKKRLEFIKEQFKDVEIIFNCLLCDKDELVLRDNMRIEEYRMGKRVEILLNEFMNECFDTNLIIDTTGKNVDEVVNKILEK